MSTTASAVNTPTPAAVDTAAAAAYIGFANQTLRAMRADGSGPRYFKVNRAIRYRIRDLDAWMEAHLVGGGRR